MPCRNLINNRRKLVRDVAWLTGNTEDCTTVAKATFVIVYKYVAREWQAYFQNYANCKK